MIEKKLGLALGAGASKGGAHIGFLEVLEENDIPVSYITGCSIGSVIGGVYAAGIPISIIKEEVLKLKRSDIISPNLNFGRGMFKGTKILKMLRKFVGDMKIEETKIPFSCIASDICTGNIYNMKKGDLKKAILASSSMPGIFPPVQIGGHYLIDGGLCKRVPVDECYELGADVVIGIDVQGKYGNPNKPGFILDVVSRAFEISDYNKTKYLTERCELFVSMQMPNYSQFKLTGMDEMIEHGRNVALSCVDRIKEILYNPDATYTAENRFVSYDAIKKVEKKPLKKSNVLNTDTV